MFKRLGEIVAASRRPSVKFALAGAFFLTAAGMAETQAADAPPVWSVTQAAPLEVGLVTRDIDKMLPFYRDVLGLKFISDVKTPPEMSVKTGATRYGYRIVRLQTPLGERIKLVQPGKNGGQPPYSDYGMGRSGFQYLTFIISDLPGTIQRLKAAKTPLLSSGEAVEVRPGVRGIFSRDPEGNFVEFVQFDDIKVYRPDYAKSADAQK